METMVRAGLVAILLVAGTSALAQTPPPPKPSGASGSHAHAVSGVTVKGRHTNRFDDTQWDMVANGGDPNEVLCSDRPIVGSRLIRHICYSRAQWLDLKREQYRHTGKMLQHLNDDSGIAAPNGNGPPGADNPP